MSENPRSREHMHNVALNAAHTIALAKLQGNLEISKCASVELALNQGLYDLGVLSEEVFQHFDARYRRPLLEIMAENQIKRENSHLPKLELEKLKKQQCQGSVQKMRTDEQFEGIKAALKGKYEQWDSHPDLDWRTKTVAYAEKYPEFEYAKRLIEKEKSVVGVS